MAFSFRIDTKHRLVLFKARGSFSSEDMLTCVEKVVSDPDFKPDFDHLVDLRDVTNFMSSADDVKVRARRDHNSRKLNASRIAIVSSSDIVFGMSRMYEILMDDADVTVRAFRNMDEATSWLGVRTD